MKYIIRDAEGGNKIAEFNTLEEAQSELNEYEEEDKEDGVYTEDFYEIFGIEYSVSVRITEIRVKSYEIENLTPEIMRKKVEANQDEHGDCTPDKTEKFDNLEDARTRFEELKGEVYNDFYPCNGLLRVVEVLLNEHNNTLNPKYGDLYNVFVLDYYISEVIR